MNDTITTRQADRSHAGRRALRVTGLVAVALLAAGTVMAAPPADRTSTMAPPPVVTASPTPTLATSQPAAPIDTYEVPAGAPGGMPGQHLPK